MKVEKLWKAWRDFKVARGYRRVWVAPNVGIDDFALKASAALTETYDEVPEYEKLIFDEWAAIVAVASRASRKTPDELVKMANKALEDGDKDKARRFLARAVAQEARADVAEMLVGLCG